MKTTFLKISKLPLDKKCSLGQSPFPCGTLRGSGRCMCDYVAMEAASARGALGQAERGEEIKVTGNVKQGKQYLCVCSVFVCV